MTGEEYKALVEKLECHAYAQGRRQDDGRLYEIHGGAILDLREKLKTVAPLLDQCNDDGSCARCGKQGWRRGLLCETCHGLVMDGKG